MPISSKRSSSSGRPVIRCFSVLPSTDNRQRNKLRCTG
jgi:hypothetical protein